MNMNLIITIKYVDYAQAVTAFGPECVPFLTDLIPMWGEGVPSCLSTIIHWCAFTVKVHFLCEFSKSHFTVRTFSLATLFKML